MVLRKLVTGLRHHISHINGEGGDGVPLRCPGKPC